MSAQPLAIKPQPLASIAGLASDSDRPNLPELIVRVTPKMVLATVLLLVVNRLWYAALRALTPDEALYWIWSRHLATGFLDHPPMIAFLIRISTTILGNNELAVRAPGVVMSIGAACLIIWITHRISGDYRCAYLAGAMLLINPFLILLGDVFTPDTPACFFSVAALASLALARDDQKPIELRRWILFGVLSGAAMLSKYTAVLPLLSIGAGLLISRSGRSEFRRPGMYLAMIIAIVVFTPTIYWNATHDWVSFRFQLRHGTIGTARLNPLPLLSFLLGQAAVFTPILFILGLAAIAKSIVPRAPLSRSENLLLASAAVPIVVFALAWLRTRGEINWADFSYFPLASLIAIYVARGEWRGPRLRWALAGCTLAAVEMLVVQVPELLWKLRIPLPAKMEEAFNWDEMAEEVGEIRHTLPCFADRYQDAAELSFYDRSAPAVWAVGFSGTPISYDYLTHPPDIAALSRVAFIGTHAELFAKTYGFRIEHADDATVVLPSKRIRDRRVTILTREIPSANLQPSIPASGPTR